MSGNQNPPEMPTISSLLLKESEAQKINALNFFQPGTSFASGMPSSTRFTITTPKDQKQLGTCTSFAVASIVEYAHGNSLDLSEAHFTVWAEKHGGDCKAGLSVVDGMTTARDHGLVEEHHWKYNDYYKAVAKARGLDPNKPWYNDDEVKQMNKDVCLLAPGTGQEKKYQLSKVEVIFSQPRTSLINSLLSSGISMAFGINVGALSAIKQLLANGTPVIVSVPVFVGGGWDTGDVVKPTNQILNSLLGRLAPDAQASPKKRGWHAIVLCGYDDSHQRFDFKNSWGNWGHQGYGTISYDYIATMCDLAMYGTK